MAYLLILRSLGQGAAVDRKNLHLIWIIHRLKGGPVMSFLAPWLASAFSLFARFLSIWIGRGRLATVLAVEGHAVK